ncbi:MAG: copper-binding protein [Bacteroidota bacterium]
MANKRIPPSAVSTIAAGVFCAGFALALTPGLGHAEGYLATQPTELEELLLGTDQIGYNVSVKEYNLETGKAYSLLIRSSGVKEYAIVAPDFFDYIWLRKIEAGGLEIKANSIYEIEFEDEGEAELFFVPIRPGTYELYAKGLQDKGTSVTINVK